MAVLAGLAGAFISLGAMFFTITTTGSELGFGVTRVLGGLVFSLGLILVILGGAELFTGNTLVVMAWANRKVSTMSLLRGWTIVYVGNFVGALLTVLLVKTSGQWQLAGDAVGARSLDIAVAKVHLGFGEAVALGILCNVLVTLAIWLSISARDFTGKVLAILFPITAFVAAGFEHSIANMYFVPLGILMKNEPGAVESASSSGRGDRRPHLARLPSQQSAPRDHWQHYWRGRARWAGLLVRVPAAQPNGTLSSNTTLRLAYGSPAWFFPADSAVEASGRLLRLQAERRVPVRHHQKRIAGNSRPPPADANHEVEQPLGILAGEQDGEPGNDDDDERRE